MSDIAEKLRKLASIETSALYHQRVVLNAAADEIARLTAENADLRNGEYLAKVIEERDRLRNERTTSAHAWQSMESAPLDTTLVIVAVPTKDRDGWIVGEAYFDPEHYEGGDWWWANMSYGDYHCGAISECNHHAPEFWQPLPAAPAIATTEGKA